MKAPDAPTISFSFIIPVYNRPQEVKELLGSMTAQTDRAFEIIIVEDGSDQPCEAICKAFEPLLSISYYNNKKSGPGFTRNFGCEKAKGNYFIFLDSDCMLPPQYVQVIRKELEHHYVDAFGGPDRAHPDFNILQKAISHSMTSFLTTGGTRGQGEQLGKFYPRSFNMGFSKEVYQKTHGFPGMRLGEDIDLSIRIIENGFSTRLIQEAYVYHKRRTTLRKFFRQVYNFGTGRIYLSKRHPSTFKFIHLLPAAITLLSITFLLLGLFVSVRFFYPFLIGALLLFVESLIKNKNLSVGLLSVVTSAIQLYGYGIGSMNAIWNRILLNREEK